MKIKTTIAGVAILMLTQTAIAQYGQGRLNELTQRLVTESADLAEASYRQSNTARSNRTDVEAMMAAQQFSASAQLFNRMVYDDRRKQDLRDAFQLLQVSAQSVERYNTQRNNWYSIQRLISDIGRELSVGDGRWNDDNQGQGSGTGRQSGRMTWKGRVDDDIRIRVRGGTADVETIGGTPYYDSQPNFTASLPPRRVNVRLTFKRGRGEIFIEQQPSRENDFTAVVRIRDTKGGASNYEFELSW